MPATKARTLQAQSVRAGDRIFVDGESCEVQAKTRVNGSHHAKGVTTPYKRILLHLGGLRWLTFDPDERIAMDDEQDSGGLFT